ncbi:aminotransferase class V-fold PLP-dependent enzyme [Ferdinandcohnia quinoae]|uniref:Aminotransferase class V-fold PLP-dependent enzyme n=1 Tax=Fredinandcohnia quinoae TaxID=2918902 RepID=A0AAW5E4C6_9BACI|nr:aminotransferase class V-fold PLP-dependent enzyme [Fredinandcohnia sp. SECRCQ15]MCH1627795.1 aminotransferase class V-fold PLP-dependent enzyme [Fredinandcohnia sp. SECRCQ15]
MTLVYKIARTKEELEKIHELNYKTFVEEIPQHAANPERKLIDQFHDENTYLICLKDEKLIGMIAVRGNRPFSLDRKLPNLDELLPLKSSKPCEVRLLAVEKEYRNGRVFLGLAQLICSYCLKEGYDMALISGTTREEKLYNQMGFKPFAPLLGTEEAAFQPMYLTKQTFDESLAGRVLRDPISFLPGPVVIQDEVKKAFEKNPISHRSNEFGYKMKEVRRRLCKMTNSHFVQILVGTGTLANDVVAAQLSMFGGKGLILANGEFGYRLVDHATRAGLEFAKIEKEWGKAIPINEVELELKKGGYSWLWAVHSETSTGMLSNISDLKMVCKNNGIRLCLDCISTLGAVELDLHDVFLASGVSGKAIGAYTGLSFVFHQQPVEPKSTLPRFLDLGMYAKNDSIPYSHSSNMIDALYEALQKYDSNEYYQEIAERYGYIRSRIEEMGFSILTNPETSSPAIMTVLLPPHISSKEVGDDMVLQGFLLHYESGYLQEKGWLQIACISKNERKNVDKMLITFKLLLQQYEIKEEEPSL